MTTLAQSLVYLAKNISNNDDENLDARPPEFHQHVANTYRILKTDHPNHDDLEGLFAAHVNEAKFLLTLLDTDLPEEMALRATELMAHDPQRDWFTPTDEIPT